MSHTPISELVNVAYAAQSKIGKWSQQAVDQMVVSAGWSVYEERRARRLARMASIETEMGDTEETYARHRKRVLGVLNDLHGISTGGAVEVIPERGLRKIAKPIGVIAAITPTTAPSAAVSQIALSALKTRNAVIFSPHPKAQRTALATVNLLRRGLAEVGAPQTLLQCLEEPTRADVTELMASADLILAAGGQGTVRRAYSSGTPAYGAGVGNSIVIIDETANVRDACGKIFVGKSFDNGTSCSSESCILIAEDVWSPAMDEFRSRGGYLCNKVEQARLAKAMWPDGRTLSRAIVGRHASEIARLSGFSVPNGTRVVIVELEGDSGGDLFGKEKLSPVLAVWRYHDFETAVARARTLLSACGRGHSCAIHTQLPDRVAAVAEGLEVSRVLVNQSTGVGNSGDFINGLPFTSVLCCGTWGGSISNENVNWRHLLNYTLVSTPIADRTPCAQEIFGAHWKRLRKPGVRSSDI